MGRMLKALKQLESQLPHAPVAPGALGELPVGSAQEPLIGGVADHAEPAPLQVEAGDLFSAAIYQLGQAIEVLPGPIDLPNYPEIAFSAPEVSVPGEAAGREPASAEEVFGANVPGTPVSDPYEGLARTIAAQLHAGAPAAVTLVSFERTDALLTIVVPLAAALTTHLGPTLVVDCDLGEPTLGERFAVPTGRGLIDLLPGPARWQEVVRPTQVPGVDLLPGRRLVAADGHPPERLDLGPLVQEWLARYRLVLLAAGPLVNPEIGSLLRSSHAAMLVVELGRTTHRSARKAVRAVRSAGAHLLGSIAVEPG